MTSRGNRFLKAAYNPQKVTANKTPKNREGPNRQAREPGDPQEMGEGRSGTIR